MRFKSNNKKGNKIPLNRQRAEPVERVLPSVYTRFNALVLKCSDTASFSLLDDPTSRFSGVQIVQVTFKNKIYQAEKSSI